ncbi:protein BatD [Dysgonomonas sp. 216]|uniref:BatD family protein n=1 Tax=Dysgonomonas sp. 216 TaxID=2302934 RepID=UPI0013D073C0|nr:BatD family protein [Dysgonomonas sp. 216]NDW17333.1 protein BatD [Dysgonomonas sp. 216]
MRKQLFLLLAIFVNIGIIQSQEVSFQANAPTAVIKGEQFRLTFILRNAEGSNAKFPTEIKGFDILFGPTVSRGSNFSSINGKTTSETTESYSYVLMGTTEGTYTIPAASITANGKTYNTNQLTIKVLPPDQTRQNQNQGNSQAGGTSGAGTGTRGGGTVNADDAFIRAIVSKTKVNEQEAFVVTFKFYTIYDVKNIGKIEFPEFEGFMVEEFELPSNRKLNLEHYNGRNYFAIDIKKSLLFPQRSGKITIPTGKMEMIFSVPSGRRVMTFFGPEEVPVDVKKTLTTSPVTIDVSPLPVGKPVSFSNAVGSFNITDKISATNVKANDAITIALDITGTGNMKLLRTPEIKLPTDFESYDPKITNNFKIVDNGLTGKKSIEYLFIPRHQGEYTIPPIQFSYFDTKSKTYKTLSTKAYKLSVAKDPNAGSNTAITYTQQNEVQAIQDIRFLKTDMRNYQELNFYFFGTTAYILWYAIPFLIFIIVFIVRRKQIQQNANIALMKTRKANKMAAKRLKTAGIYLKEHNKEKFYEEILRATWGYLSDKLSIPAANLNRDNIEQELSKYGISESLAATFISILDTGEFARYAPAESENAMDKLYEQTVNAISEMDNAIKKKKK